MERSGGFGGEEFLWFLHGFLAKEREIQEELRIELEDKDYIMGTYGGKRKNTNRQG